MMTFKLYMANEMNNVIYDYSSTQINLPSQLAADVIQWGEDSIKDGDVYTTPDDPSFGREDEMHVTVLYGLHTTSAEKVKKVLAGEESLEIRLGVVSMFSTNDKFDVIKIEVLSPSLHKLHHMLARNLPCSQMYPRFNPHVTIAYVKKGRCTGLLGSGAFKGKSWQADSIIFSSKSGTKTSIPLKVTTTS